MRPIRLPQNLKSKRLLVSAVMLGVVFAGFRVWKDYLEDRVIPKRWGVVEENLVYRSGQLSEALVHRMLKEHNIRKVIDYTCGIPRDGADQRAELAAVNELGIESVHLPLRGNGTGDISSYVSGIKEIHESVKSGEPVLIHCAAGSQRTGGTIACYRMLVQGYSPEMALDEMQQYNFRHRRNPDLIPFINQNMEELAKRLVANGTIEKIPDPLPQMPETYRVGPFRFNATANAKEGRPQDREKG